MPWIDRKIKPHYCPEIGLPDPKEAYKSGANVGSVYECDKEDCKRQWHLQDSQREGMYWTEFKPWPTEEEYKKHTS